MITTHIKTISIQTDIGNYDVHFNPSVPAGWEAIQSAIAKHYKDGDMARAVAQKDKDAGAVYWIQKQAENAEAFIDAIRKSIGDEEFGKVKEILRLIDISDLLQICMSIMASYTEYYQKMLKEGLEP